MQFTKTSGLFFLLSFLFVSALFFSLADAQEFQPLAAHSLKNDVSLSLRSIKPSPPSIKKGIESEIPLRPLPKSKERNISALPTDRLIQKWTGALNMPSTDLTFEGLSNEDNYNALGYRVLPPDTNGDIGPNHYVQIVNLVFAVYDRGGNLILGPFPDNVLWSGFGGPCEANNDGDPIVLYDHLADRWLISQFAVTGPYFQCIAVSKTGDPAGEYYRYAFLVSDTKMNDYPKFGIWPDGYYMSANQFEGGSSWAGSGAFAFEREKMLKGEPAQMIYFDLGAVDLSFGGMLPSDLDGLTLPPAGSPNYFMEVDDSAWIAPNDALRMWQFHADWSTPLNSTFGLSGQPNAVMDTAAWDPLCIGSEDCIPQPGVGSTAYLDAIGDRLMYRLQYRNIGTYESLVVNHTVDSGGGRAGIRWYEVRSPNSFPLIYQQGTYAPADTEHRWMGSIAMDNQGNMALGYSVSSNTVYPSIRYSGRLVSDPLDTMPQGEAEMQAGSGSQTHTGSRWGDYSMMSVDPIDDCTFWYTTEYYTSGSLCPDAYTACWHTKIGHFKFPSCTPPQQGTLSGFVKDALTNAPIAGALVETGLYGRTTNSFGFYEFILPPGTYNLTASAPPNYGSLTISGVNVSNGGATTQDFSLSAVPNAIVSNYVIMDSCALGGPGNNNGIIEPGETITMPLMLTNTGGIDLTNITGILSSSTTGINITDNFASWPDIAVGNTQSSTWNHFKFGVSATSTCGADIEFNLVNTYDQGTSSTGWTAPIGGSVVEALPLLNEEFASGIPGTWSVVNGGACTETWRTDNPGSRTISLPFSEPFAIADSDAAGNTCGIMDEELITPSVDASSCSQVILEFSNQYRSLALGDTADVDVSNNGGASWTNALRMTTDSGYPAPNTKSIDISAYAAGQSDVKIKFHYYNADWAWWWAIDNVKVRCFAPACNVCAPQSYSNVTVITPNGGESIPSGQGYNIQWGAPSNAVRFNLKYSIDNGKTWKLIAKDLADSNYNWMAPPTLNNKKKSFIKVKGFDSNGQAVGTDISDAPFTIEVVKLTSPDGGQTWTSGIQYNITWATYETVRPVRKVELFYTTNAGTTWNLIGRIKGSNPGEYLWTAPDVPEIKPNSKVKIVLKDASGNVIGRDSSDDYFTISP